MSKLIKLEMKKAICSKFFLMGLALLLLFALLSAWYIIECNGNYNPEKITNSLIMENGSFYMNPDISLYGFYKGWVGADVLSIAGNVFFKIIPIAAAIPYGWTFCREYKSGYLKNIASRVDKKKYIIAKSLAVFTSGALVVLIPLIVNIMLVSSFLPLADSIVDNVIYNYISFGYLWADLFFTHPFTYVILYVMLDVLYGGIFALLSFAISFYVRNVFAALFFPFIATLIMGFIEKNIWTNIPGEIYKVINPVSFLPSNQNNVIVWWMVLLVTSVLCAFILATIIFKGCRDEIF
ncbi:MAG: hypothetical protein E7564_08995 [Ruminococcaceae bacterium]|nr:hypothetical protein [Oscillospiraceae bacterium]